MTTKYWEAIKARPTTYNGVKMRSRLEARFAAGLDKLGIEWKYEPECFADESGQYLPDFWLGLNGVYEARSLTYVEVKPIADNVAEDCRIMERILSSVPTATLVWASPAVGSRLLVNEPVLEGQRCWRWSNWCEYRWTEGGRGYVCAFAGFTEGWKTNRDDIFMGFDMSEPAEFDWSWK